MGSQRNEVRVMKVRATLPMYPHILPNLGDFICTHHDFIGINELMTLPVSLYFLSTDLQLAYLVRVKGDADVYNTKKYPFVHYGQKRDAVYAYVVPLARFYRYVDTLDVIDRRVVWIHHSFRCGSTIWAQIFHDLPGWTVISENLFHPHTMIGELPVDEAFEFSKSGEFRQMALAGFKFNVSRAPADHNVVVKGAYHEGYLFDTVAPTFKNMTILHVYRNVLPSGKSMYNAFIHFDNIEMMFERAGNQFFWSEYYMRNIAGAYTMSWPDTVAAIRQTPPTDIFEWFVAVWCSLNSIALKNIHKYDIKCIKFEHFQSDKKSSIDKVFRYLDIDQSLAASALQSVERDSQANTYISHKERAKSKMWQRIEESVKRCNRILQTLGFPDIDSDFTMPNTL